MLTQRQYLQSSFKGVSSTGTNLVQPEPILMLVSKARACLSKAPYTTNIRIGWKSMQGTNILAYCEHV